MAWFFARRWMERVEATPEKLVSALASRLDKMLDDFKERMDRIEQDAKSCTLTFMDKFRTKEESKQAWEEHKAHEAKQWAKLDSLSERVARLETASKLNHE